MRAKETWNQRRFTLDEAVNAAAMVVGTALYVAAAWASINAPRLHAEAEQYMAAEIEAENRDSCQRLGMPPGSGLYNGCAVELSRVRDQHAGRAARRAAGLP